MKIYGFDSVQPLVESEGFVFKLLATDQVAVLFPHATEHRDVHVAGIRYSDDSGGNGIAVMVVPGRIEFRFHRDFSDERVRRLAKAILKQPDFNFAAGYEVTYQGRILIPSG